MQTLLGKASMSQICENYALSFESVITVTSK